MPPLTINDHVILRLPAFSYRGELKDRWEDLKEMIRDSSPEFYLIIKDLSYEELAGADKKVRQTVQKYFNRARFRATPYGRFATVGMATLSPTGNNVVVPDEPLVHRFSDWSELTHGISNLETVQKEKSLLFANTTFYELSEEIRFVQKTVTGYHLVAIDHDPLITDILQHCLTPISYSELQDKMSDQLTAEELESYTDHLLNLQLLTSSLEPNIIGIDYFQRIGNSVTTEKSYLIAERSAIKGNFDKKLIQHLPGLVDTLQKVLPYSQPQALTDFKTRFIKRFEEAEVPLMMVLDAEAGIGYGNLELYSDNQALEIFFAGNNEEQLTKGNQQLQNLLFKAILEQDTRKDIIDLEKLVQYKNPVATTPNSISAGVTVSDDLLILEYLGGASAIAIAGRFALGIKEIEQFCKSIACKEQTANPDILLFDIGYTKENGIDNINRRPSLYELQLNILNYDTSQSPLAANDLMVSIKNNEVILRSARLNKRMLPRMTTTYNYMRSDLSLFRFLMDIQNQGLRTEMLFRPTGFIPGLKHYPRIQYKNIIVSPTSWRLDKALFDKSDIFESKVQKLKAYLESNIHCKHIRTGFADQTLLLDVEKREDMELLAGLLEKSNNLYIEEAILPKHPIVATADGRPLLPQLILTLQHNNPIAQPLSAYNQQSVQERKIFIAPGADWLYFQIFCNPHRGEVLLDGKISAFLENNRAALEKWFFIRYNEGGDHIRLRMQLKDKSQGYALLAKLSALLQPELDTGTIHDIKLCTYKKETARYSSERIGQIEAHFYRDSEFVLSMLQAMLPVNARYHLCTDIIHAISDSNVLDNGQMTGFLQAMTNAYNEEHNITTPQFKELNLRYKGFQKEALPPLNINSEALHERLKCSFIEILQNSPKDIRQKLLGDLLHMHVNRLFTTHQRTHEMVLYNFLLLEYKSRKHKKRAKVS